MAQQRLSMRKVREVLRLKFEAYLSERQIAAIVGCSRSTVQQCLHVPRQPVSAGRCRPNSTSSRSRHGSTRSRTLRL